MEPSSPTPTTAAAQTSQAERLLRAFRTAGSTTDIMRLVAATPDDALDGLEAAVGKKLTTVQENERAGLQQRLDDLRAWRATEQQARRTLARLGDAGSQALADRLVEWIQTPDWDASAAFMRAHAAELLTGEGAAALTLLHMHNAGNEQVELHAGLLAACREHGIEAAYEQLRQESGQASGLAEAARAVAESPLLQAVMEWRAGGRRRGRPQEVLEARATCS